MAWGVAFGSLQESYLDSLGPFSDVVISLLASIAKLERDEITERTLAGLARARKQGRIGGRPRADEDPKLLAEVERLHKHGASVRVIAKQLGKSPATIQKLVNAPAGRAGLSLTLLDACLPWLGTVTTPHGRLL